LVSVLVSSCLRRACKRRRWAAAAATAIKDAKVFAAILPLVLRPSLTL
jgi:hypothetical protein